MWQRWWEKLAGRGTLDPDAILPDPFSVGRPTPPPPHRRLAHAAAVTALEVDAQGERFLAGTADGRLTVWSLAAGERVGEWQAHEGAVTRLRLSPDGALLASGGTDAPDALRLWALPEGRLLQTVQNDWSPAAQVWNEAADDLNGYLHLNRGALLPGWFAEGPTLIAYSSLLYGPDGGPGATVGSGAWWFRQWWPGTDGTFAPSSEAFWPPGPWHGALHLAAHVPQLLAGGWNTGARVRNALTGATHDMALRGRILGLSPDGTWLFSAVADVVARWEVATSRLDGAWRVPLDGPLVPSELPALQPRAKAEVLPQPPVQPRHAKISVDGTALLLLCTDERRADQLPSAWARELARRKGVVGQYQKNGRWFDLQSGACRLTLPQVSEANVLALTPDGARLLVAGGSEVLLWEV